MRSVKFFRERQGEGLESVFDKQLLARQYFLALIILGLMLFLLYIFPVSRMSLGLPVANGLSNNPWNGSDILTYVNPARAFLKTGVFLREGEPDIHRTIGYPLFIAVIMGLFGKYWVTATYLLQLTVFAALYPAVAFLSRAWFGFSVRKTYWLFAILIGSGVGVAYVGILLTDQIFTSLLLLGVALGVAAVLRKSLALTILHILIVGWAAQIRPTLSLFWIVELCFLLFTCRMWDIRYTPKVKTIIAISVACIAIVGSAPALRNYINHGVFTPTDVLSNNLAYYLAGPVLIASGKTIEYQTARSQLKLIHVVKRIGEQKTFAKNVIHKYPFETIKRVSYHAFWNLFEPHWEYIAFVFGSGFSLNELFDDAGNLQRRLLYVIPFMMFYSLVYILNVFCFYYFIKVRNWYLAIGIAVFYLPLAASLINGQGARMRLCVEPVLFMVAFYGWGVLSVEKKNNDLKQMPL